MDYGFFLPQLLQLAQMAEERKEQERQRRDPLYQLMSGLTQGTQNVMNQILPMYASKKIGDKFAQQKVDKLSGALSQNENPRLQSFVKWFRITGDPQTAAMLSDADYEADYTKAQQAARGTIRGMRTPDTADTSVREKPLLGAMLGTQPATTTMQGALPAATLKKTPGAFPSLEASRMRMREMFPVLRQEDVQKVTDSAYKEEQGDLRLSLERELTNLRTSAWEQVKKEPDWEQNWKQKLGMVGEGPGRKLINDAIAGGLQLSASEVETVLNNVFGSPGELQPDPRMNVAKAYNRVVKELKPEQMTEDNILRVCIEERLSTADARLVVDALEQKASDDGIPGGQKKYANISNEELARKIDMTKTLYEMISKETPDDPRLSKLGSEWADMFLEQTHRRALQSIDLEGIEGEGIPPMGVPSTGGPGEPLQQYQNALGRLKDTTEMEPSELNSVALDLTRAMRGLRWPPERIKEELAGLEWLPEDKRAQVTDIVAAVLSPGTRAEAQKRIHDRQVAERAATEGKINPLFPQEGFDWLMERGPQVFLPEFVGGVAGQIKAEGLLGEQEMGMLKDIVALPKKEKLSPILQSVGKRLKKPYRSVMDTLGLSRGEEAVAAPAPPAEIPKKIPPEYSALPRELQDMALALKSDYLSGEKTWEEIKREVGVALEGQSDSVIGLVLHYVKYGD